MFRFKQFSILQEQAAMKVGTDGVLLGAWCSVEKVNTVLDIGTGTGLIALMLAQKSSKARIDAVEVDESAAQEAEQNFINSNWSDRLNLYLSSLQEFKPNKTYDFIVSNPPYYTDTFSSEQTQRTLARHVASLSFRDLLRICVGLLNNTGSCAFIIPYKEELGFIALAKEVGLFICKITRVKGREDLPFKRSLLCFNKTKEINLVDELIIEVDRHVYTDKYIALTQEFYLKM